MKNWERLALVAVVVYLVSRLTMNVYRYNLAKKVIAQWKGSVEAFLRLYPGVTSDVVLAMICQESGGEQSAVNPNDPSYGLLQITKPALTDFNRHYLRSYTMEQLASSALINLEVGMGFYEMKLDQYNQDVSLAVEAYNDGKGNRQGGGVAHWKKVAEYLGYIQTIMKG